MYYANLSERQQLKQSVYSKSNKCILKLLEYEMIGENARILIIYVKMSVTRGCEQYFPNIRILTNLTKRIEYK